MIVHSAKKQKIKTREKWQNGKKWKTMKNNEKQWKTMKHNETQWKTMKNNEKQCKKMQKRQQQRGKYTAFGLPSWSPTLVLTGFDLA